MSSLFARPRQVSLLGLTAAIAVGGLAVPVAHAAAAESPTSGPVPSTTNGVIAFTTTDNASPPVIKTVNPDGTGYATLALSGGGLKLANGFAMPAYSPDGTKIVFDGTAVSGPGAGNDEVLWIANADGSGAVQLSANNKILGIEDSIPHWSADGQHILFDKYDTTDANVSAYQIWEVNPDGTGEHAIETYPSGTAGRDYDASEAPNGDIAFTRGTVSATGSFTVGVWVRDHATGTETLIAPGAQQPVFSPDGSQIVCQSTSTSTNTIMVMSPTGGSPRALTPTAASTSYQNPSWSPDGTEIVYSVQTPTGQRIQTIGLTAGSAPVTVDAATPANFGDAFPSWRAAAPAQPTPIPSPSPGGPKVFRDAGGDRTATGIIISQRKWTAAGSAKAVVLATSLNFPDALSGGPLAAKKSGPLLLTDGSATQLDPRVKAEIQRVLPAGGSVYVLGGDAAIKPAIVSQLKSLGYAVTQFKGHDRADTALRVAHDGMGAPQHVVLATGAGFADALAAGPYAAGPFADAPGAPAAIVLSDGAHLDPATAAFLKGKTVATVGAQAGHAWPTAAKSFSGLDRFDTAARVAREFTGAFATTQVGIANGVASATNPGYPDALTGGAFMAESNGPIVLVDGINSNVPAESAAVLGARTGNVRADIFGGASIITPGLAASIVTLLHGTAQF